MQLGLDSCPDPWLSWCDSQRQWRPLLAQAIKQRKLEAKRAVALARIQGGVVTER